MKNKGFYLMMVAVVVLVAASVACGGGGDGTLTGDDPLNDGEDYRVGKIRADCPSDCVCDSVKKGFVPTSCGINTSAENNAADN